MFIIRFLDKAIAQLHYLSDVAHLGIRPRPPTPTEKEQNRDLITYCLDFKYLGKWLSYVLRTTKTLKCARRQ